MMSSPESNPGHIGQRSERFIFLTCQTYAQRARTIVNRAVINEDPNARIIRGELKNASQKIIFSLNINGFKGTLCSINGKKMIRSGD